MKKQLCHMSLFLCLFSILLGQYCQKNPAKSGGFRKNIKRGDGNIGGRVFQIVLRSGGELEFCWGGGFAQGIFFDLLRLL